MSSKTDFKLASPEQVVREMGSQLAALRLSRNITQQDLAREAGIAERTLRRFEAGERASLDTFIRILQGLGLAARLDALLPDPTLSPMSHPQIAALQRPARPGVASPGTGRPVKLRRARPKAVKKAAPWSWDEKESP